MKQPKLLLIFACIGFFAYFPSLFGSFVWDDEDFVYANQYVIHHDFAQFFTHQAIAGRNKESNYYRPIPESSYAIMHAFFGLNPFVFHLFNILSHIATGIIIFIFLEKFIDIFTTISKKVKRYISFITVLIFLIHPIQTETVSYISGLSDPLYVFWGFAMLTLFLICNEYRYKKLSKTKQYMWYAASLSSFAMSVLSKEIGLAFLGLQTLIGIFFIIKSKNKQKELIQQIIYVIPFILFTIFYLWIHFHFINTLDMKAQWGNSLYANSLLIRIATFIQNIFTYFALLLFPKDLFMERDATIPIQYTLLNTYTFAFLVLNGVLVYMLYRLRKTSSSFLLVFLYVSFYMAFIPVSGIMLINGMFYEHFTYLPLVFFFCFLVTVFSIIFGKYFKGNKSMRLMGIIIFIVYVLILIIRSYIRQAEWNDPVKFYSQTLIHAPQSIRIRNGLAMAYADQNNTRLAIEEYKKAIAIDNKIPNLYHNLGNSYAAIGDIQNAEVNYKKAIEVSPQFIFSYQSLYSLYLQTNQKEKAAEIIKEIKKEFPNISIQ